MNKQTKHSFPGYSCCKKPQLWKIEPVGPLIYLVRARMGVGKFYSVLDECSKMQSVYYYMW